MFTYLLVVNGDIGNTLESRLTTERIWVRFPNEWGCMSNNPFKPVALVHLAIIRYAKVPGCKTDHCGSYSGGN